MEKLKNKSLRELDLIKGVLENKIKYLNADIEKLEDRLPTNMHEIKLWRSEEEVKDILKRKEETLDEIGKVNSKVLTIESRIELIDSIMFEKVNSLFD